MLDLPPGSQDSSYIHEGLGMHPGVIGHRIHGTNGLFNYCTWMAEIYGKIVGVSI